MEKKYALARSFNNNNVLTAINIAKTEGKTAEEYGEYEGNFFKDFPAAMFPVMYRYQKGKFFLRGGFNLFISWPTIPSPSVSAGFRF